MNTNKFIINGIVASIVSFILGNLFYNFLFKTYFDANIYATDFSTVKWWAIIGSTMCWGFLYAFILEKAKVTTILDGAIMAFTVAVIIQTTIDLGFYAVSLIYKDLAVIVADVFLTAFNASMMGAAIMFVSNRNKKTA
jgi:hypothetical protein